MNSCTLLIALSIGVALFALPESVQADAYQDGLVAAQIGNLWAPADLSRFDDEALRMAGRMLLEQKVSLQRFCEVYGESVMNTPLAEFINSDAAKYVSEREEFEAIRNRFVAAGVDSMLFKSAGLAPSFHYLSSNLLVDQIVLN